MVPPREKEGEIVPEEYFPGEEVRFKGCLALATRFPAHGMHEFLSHEIIWSPSIAYKI